MQILCDVCEATAATLFCPADEAALCASCDVKVHELAPFYDYKEHMNNKLASSHVRHDLPPSSFGKCDLCDREKAFLFCEKGGMCICLTCDMVFHIGHPRFLVMRQKIQFPVEDPIWGKPISRPLNQAEIKREQNDPLEMTIGEDQQNHKVFPTAVADVRATSKAKRGNKMIDLNRKPRNPKAAAPKYKKKQTIDLKALLALECQTSNHHLQFP
ncbi:B-box zinc finger protein 19 [Citrus sinensis]|uniref:B-box zinc finger protein 19 n=1 Tax=Citrus sinensis TaxID=2711 RepID=A0ACB8J0X0_CITSI|nr:B-box zinc finger protein 19 [Citrus sinensis]